MTSVRRALALSFAERYALIALALASSIVIARLLSPEEIGIYSVSLAVIGIAQVLRDFGIGNFLIQEKNLSDDHIRTAFGMSLLIGGALFLLVFAGAPWAGSFYGEGRMVSTLRITALNFLVLPFCTISLALLRREMRFHRLLFVMLGAALAGFVVTIGLALAGFGPNSMAVGAVVSNAATGFGAWLGRAGRKMLAPSLREWRALLNFGAQSSAANIVTTISMDISDLALGKILGFAPVAMISRAQGLMNLFHRDLMGAIRNVAYPAFAAAARQGADLESRHRVAVAAITAVAWPFYGFVALFAPEMLRLLFGPQWGAAAPMVPWFCLGGAAGATYGLIIPLMISQGRVDLGSRIDLVMQPIRACLSVAVVWSTNSLDAFAVVFALLSIAAVPYHYWVKSDLQRTDIRAAARDLAKSLFVAVASCAVPALIHIAGPRTDGLVSLTLLVCAAFAFALSWLVAMLSIRHPVMADPAITKQLERIPLFRRLLGRHAC